MDKHSKCSKVKCLRASPIDFEYYDFDYNIGKDRAGLVFDPFLGKLSLEYFHVKFPYICTHKREYRPGSIVSFCILFENP